MKGRIKNRIAVSKVMTQTRCQGGNPDKGFEKKTSSRYLYSNAENLAVRAENRAHPNATFSRVNLGANAFVWVATNKAGEEYIASLPEAERNAFLYHQPPQVRKEKPESRRVVDGRPIKGLPNGHREADYFPSDRSFKPSSVRHIYFEPEPKDLSEDEVNKLRSLVSEGKL